MPGITRRQLCAGTALAGVGWSLGGCDSPPVPSGQPLTLEGLRPLVGTQFMMRNEGGSRALTLAGIVEGRPPIRRPRPQGQSFTLLFDGDVGDDPAQGLRSMDHPQLGAFSLFLVPRRRGFAATFCRL